MVVFDYLFEIFLIILVLWTINSCNNSIRNEYRILRKNKNSNKRIQREIIKYANTKPLFLY